MIYKEKTGSKFLLIESTFIESLSYYRCQKYREAENIACNLRHLCYFAGNRHFLKLYKRLFAFVPKSTNISQSSLHIK